jgi:histone demethylase JARID1
VWYGIPSSATAALEAAMRDALPHLFAANPRLLYQLVTTLSPAELKVIAVAGIALY